MINQIVEAIKKTALMHKAVNRFCYQQKIDINQQPNNPNYQVILEQDYLMRFSGETGQIILNMDVLGFVTNTEQETQDICTQIALSIITRTIQQNRNIMSLISYDILGFVKQTDDVSSGVRVTLTLAIPLFIDYCIEDDYFLTEEEYTQKIESKDKELNLGDSNTNTGLDLKPLEL